MQFKAVRPGATKYIEEEVKEWVKALHGFFPVYLNPYQNAVAAIWPTLCERGRVAVAVEVFMQVAEEEKFVIDEHHFRSTIAA